MQLQGIVNVHVRSCIGNSAGYKFAEAKILNVEGLGNELGNTDLFQLTVTIGYICHCRKLGRVSGLMELMVILCSRKT